jgi:hypothetical protein
VIGDLVLYYNGHGWAPTDTVHVSMIRQPGKDPLTMSHGSDPAAFVHVSYDGRPHKFFSIVKTKMVPGPVKNLIIAPHPHGGDALCNVANKTFMGIPNPAELTVLMKRGWAFDKDNLVVPKSWFNNAHQVAFKAP